MMSDEINNIRSVCNAGGSSYHAGNNTKALCRYVLQSIPHTQSHDNDAMQKWKKFKKSTKKRAA